VPDEQSFKVLRFFKTVASNSTNNINLYIEFYHRASIAAKDVQTYLKHFEVDQPFCNVSPTLFYSMHYQCSFDH
jgi:hypothetical protein